MPDPDLVIRTGGEKRLSNFLLYQSAYAELYFSDKMFPDFSQKDLDSAFEEYSSRERKFGKVTE
jgi:undecaprenyl diphosphate synthase